MTEAESVTPFNSGSMKPINVSRRFLRYFTMMFWVSCLSVFSVFLGSLGMVVSCFGKIGGFVHGLTNILYLILIVFGSYWRWSNTGRFCSADEILQEVCPPNSTSCDPKMNNQFKLPLDANWQYWSNSGFAMSIILFVQYLTIFCLFCCSCMFPAGAKGY